MLTTIDVVCRTCTVTSKVWDNSWWYGNAAMLFRRSGTTNHCRT